MLDGAVHHRFDWQQSVVRCSDNRDEVVDEVVERVPDHGHENPSTGKVTVAMDEERLNDYSKVRDEQEGVHRVRSEFLSQYWNYLWWWA